MYHTFDWVAVTLDVVVTSGDVILPVLAGISRHLFTGRGLSFAVSVHTSTASLNDTRLC